MDNFTAPRGLLGMSQRPGQPATNMFYPRGWSGGLLGLGNPAAQAAAAQQREQQMRNTAALEMQQRGLAEGPDAQKKAIVAGRAVSLRRSDGLCLRWAVRHGQDCLSRHRREVCAHGK